MKISRRKFIEAAIFIGAAPRALAQLVGVEASSKDNKIWSLIEEEPVTFIVGEGGTLDLPYSVGPSNRFEAYDLWTQGETPSQKVLIEVVEQINSGFEAVRRWKESNFLYLEDFDQDDWEEEDLADYAQYLAYSDWVDDLDDSEQAITFIKRLSAKHLNELALYMTKWAESGDYGPEEWEEFHYPASGQDYAFRFFNMQDFALSEALGVKVVEGDRPGSNYYAAELRISAEDANSRAAGHGIPVRFEQQAGQIGA